MPFNFRNPNESAYVGGRKHFLDVIKSTAPEGVLIWKQPEEDFNNNSTLIVNPGETALFVDGGQIVAEFANGTYKLNTQNYPFISRLRNLLSGGISAYNCFVYYIRDAHSKEIRWGTQSPIQVRDPKLHIATKLGANGSYKYRIEDGKLLISKLVGGNTASMNQNQLVEEYFANEFQMKIRSVLTAQLKNWPDELLGLESDIERFSEMIQPALDEAFREYGLRMVQFTISSITILDDEYRAKVENAFADSGVMDVLGGRWAQQQAVNILGDLANNPGAGGAGAAMGAGMGMGIGAGGAMASLAQAAFAPITQQVQVQQPYVQPSGRFGQAPAQATPAAPAAPAAEDPMETLSKLKKMLDAGLIPQEMYDKKVSEILSRM